MHDVHRLRRPLAPAAALTAALAGPAAAHGGPHGVAPWAVWHADPEILAAALLAAALYLRGAWRRAQAGRPMAPWRHLVFLAGLAMTVAALESPVDAMAEELFWMHQVQHMLLRITGPMALAFAAPQGALSAGLPRVLRRRALAPVLRRRGLRGAWAWIRRPVPLFAIYVASLYLWELPRLHDLSLRDDGVHYVMHATMLAAGLLFWAAIFDPRDAPKGLSHRTRLALLVGSILSNMLIGSLTTLKTMVLYPAYGLGPRLFDTPPLADETAGGFLIWAPSSMMSLIAMLLVFDAWKRAEIRRTPPPAPTTAAGLRAATAEANRRAGRMLGAMSLGVFTLAATTAITVVLLG